MTVETSSAGAFHNTGESNEPCWNFRLWKASLVLAKYLEDHSSLVKDKVVIELGAGTGLLSILTSLLGARLTVCTDLKVALPLILHNAQINLSKNHILYHPGVESAGTQGGSTGKCLKGHNVTMTLTESDEYICNVCEEELPEAAELFSCRECNFDFCHDCNQKIVDSSRHFELPTWLQCQLDATTPSSLSLTDNDNNTNNLLVITQFNWNDFTQYGDIWKDLEAKSLLVTDSLSLILASDVTYNLHAVQLFFFVMDSLVNYHTSLCKQELSFLLAHHCRSEETTGEVLRQFDVRSSWKTCVHSYDSNEQKILSDEAEVVANTREVLIFSVVISLV